MDKLKMHSMNKVDENIKKIGALFPNCVTERKNDAGEVEYAIDFDMLKQELSDIVVEGKEERYQFTWPDKKKSILAANAPISDTLRPCREESVDFDNTQNLYIEGDNLAVLKLLQETYLGKIKMIYIDPPYNTGNDFVYNDDFAESAEEYFAHSGQFDEEGNRLVANTESNGRFHTDWLNMIYPRLKLAKDLLTDDGLIFISIDDNEVENIKKACIEIFGEANYLGEFPRVTKRGGKSTDFISKNHDYCLVFSKSDDFLVYPLEHTDEGFSNQDEYEAERGKFKLNQTLDYDTLGYINSLDYPITINGTTYYAGDVSEEEYLARKKENPQNGYRWRWSKDLFDFGYEHGFIVVKRTSNGSRIYTKTYQNATISKGGKGYFVEIKPRTKAVSTLELTDNIYSNDNAKKGIDNLMGRSMFEYTKPLTLLLLLSKLTTKNDDIILDFFSGSATTAHAVMQLNAEDGGNRKFIMVQLPEETEEKSEAYKAGYKNICEIGKERIRRAGAKIKADRTIKIDVDKSQLMQRTLLDDGTFDDKYALKVTPANDDDVLDNLDTGFRVLKLDSSNMKDVYYTPDEYEMNMFDMLSDNIKEDRTPEDLLFQVMLDLGVLLSSKIEEEIIAGKKVFNVADGFLYACFDNNVSEETITEIAKKKPYYFVMRDSSMANDSVATNFEQIFATYSPDTERKVL